MYTLSTCPWCMKTKKFFTARNVQFDSIDYDLEDDARQAEIMEHMSSKGAGIAFPFVIIGDDVVVGYDPDRYAELLELGRDEGDVEKRSA